LVYFIASPRLLDKLAGRAQDRLDHQAYLRAVADALDGAERFRDPGAIGEMKVHLRISEACADSMAAMLRGIAEEMCS